MIRIATNKTFIIDSEEELAAGFGAGFGPGQGFGAGFGPQGPGFGPGYVGFGFPNAFFWVFENYILKIIKFKNLVQTQKGMVNKDRHWLR